MARLSVITVLRNSYIEQYTLLGLTFILTNIQIPLVIGFWYFSEALAHRKAISTSEFYR